VGINESVVLLIEPEEDHHKLVDAADARKRGYVYLAQWLEREPKANGRNGAGLQAKSMSIYERLDRVHGLTSQNPRARYRVIYNKSGTFVAAAIVENESRDLDVGGQTVTVTGYVSDYNLYYFETEDLDIDWRSR